MVGSVARKSTNILQTPQLFLIVENAPKSAISLFRSIHPQNIDIICIIERQTFHCARHIYRPLFWRVYPALYQHERAWKIISLSIRHTQNLTHIEGIGEHGLTIGTTGRGLNKLFILGPCCDEVCRPFHCCHPNVW